MSLQDGITKCLHKEMEMYNKNNKYRNVFSQ